MERKKKGRALMGCQGVSVHNPNTCRNRKACIVVKGKFRHYCRRKAFTKKNKLPTPKTPTPKTPTPKTSTPLPKTPTPLPKTPTPLPKTPTPLPKKLNTKKQKIDRKMEAYRIHIEKMRKGRYQNQRKYHYNLSFRKK